MNRIAIGEVCNVYDGPHATPTKIDKGPVYLGIDAITDNGKINPAGYNYLSEEDYVKWTKRVTPQYGDIVFSYEATLGRYALIPMGFYGCLGRRLAIVRPKDERINVKWLYYYFRSTEWSVFIKNNTVKGSTVDRISVEDFPKYEIPLIDRGEQDKIVAVLSAIDDKIDNNQKINDNLEQQAMTLYNQWFTQFDFPDQDGNPYKSTGNKMGYNSLINITIPEGWNVLKLSDVIENICTGLNPRDKFVLGNGNIRYVTVKNLTTSGTLDFSGCDTIDQQARNIVHNRSNISIGDILFASIAPLGRCYLILDEPRDWDINESVFSIRANKKFLTPDYLYMYFMSDSFIKGATSSSTGSIFKGIRIGTLQDTLAVIPPLEIVEAFTGKVHQLLVLKSKITMESEQLVQLRDWLLPMLMNGQATIED